LIANLGFTCCRYNTLPVGLRPLGLREKSLFEGYGL
jgi:hypothetical protein